MLNGRSRLYWISFLFLTTWKLSHLIKTKFIENENRVLKKKTSKKKKKKRKKERKEKKKKKKRETCPRRDLNLRLWTRKQRKKTELTHSTTPGSAGKVGLKHIPSIQWLTVFRNKFLGFLYNYEIFNWN